MERSQGASGENGEPRGGVAPGEDRNRVSLLWGSSLRLLLFSIFLAFAAKSFADPDLWGHLLFGQRMLDLGHVTRVDPYSFLSDPAWINHEWLAEVIFASAWEMAGPPGLVLLKVAVVLLLLALIYLHLRRQDLDVLRAGFIVTLVLLPLTPGVRTVRPQLFTLLLFTLTLLVLIRVEEGEHRSAWLLPVIVALWVNLHGGVLAGLGTIGLWAAGHAALVLYRERRAGSLFAGGRKHVWGAVLTSVLALLANPYGPDLPIFLLETGTVDRPFITEWRALDPTSLLGGIYLLFLLVGGLSLLRSPREVRPATAILLPVMALLPITAVRHLPLFGIAVALLAAPEIADILGRRSSTGSSEESRPLVRAGVSGLLVIAAGTFLLGVPKDVRCIPVGSEFPVEAVSALEDSGARGLLAVNFSWGEYAIWHLHGQFQVSMDGRRETVYPDSVYRNHLDFIYGNHDWDKVLDAHPVNVALVPADRAADNLLELKPGWGEGYRDSLAAVHVREGTDQAERVGSAAVTRRHPARMSDDEPGGGGEGEERLCFP